MEVLLTNDDGITSEGLWALEVAFREQGHQVTLVAPDRERSATSHSVTLFTPLLATERPQPGGGSRAYAVNGTPADCVKLALHELLEGQRPALVASGINRGWNLGVNIFYSGTIGGAFEGLLAGIPALAVSVPSSRSHDHLEVARMTVSLVEPLLGEELMEPGIRTLYNLNFPDCPPGEIRGLHVVPHGLSAFVDSYERRVDPRQREYFWLSGEQGYAYPDGASPRELDDLQAVREGFLALSPLRFDLNHARELERLRGLQLALPVPPREAAP